LLLELFDSLCIGLEATREPWRTFVAAVVALANTTAQAAAAATATPRAMRRRKDRCIQTPSS